MNELEIQRDDGLLAAWLRGRDRPLPASVLLVAAVGVGVGGAAASPAHLAWSWLLAGLCLALAAAAGRTEGRMHWSHPALLRALEYGSVLVSVGSSPWAYLLLATLAYHHYDIVYRARVRSTGPPRWLTVVAGGWELRTSVLVVATALGVAEPAALLLAAALAGILLVESVSSWWPNASNHTDR